jgi:hypothetical protein
LNSPIDQEWKNRRKIIAAAIRLEQSIIADNILNRIMDEEYKKFYKAVQEGKRLPAFDPKKALGVA